jgi:hypothetical protein
MPEGHSEAEFQLSLSEVTSPPRSGGLLATLHVWQRLLVVGPRRFGEVYYVGKLPWKSDNEPADCLAATYAGVDARFYFDPASGDIIGVQMQASDDQDPCEISFSDTRDIDGRWLPHRWTVRHGDEVFADITISAWERPASNAPVADQK